PPSSRLPRAVPSEQPSADVLANLDQAVLRPGHSAFDEQEVPLRVDGVDGETDLRGTLPAHAAGHLDALEDTRRGRGGADRARLADVVRAVRDGAAAEVVPLDRALEALADSGARDLHLVARLEDLDRHVLTLDRLGEMPAELDEMPVGAVDAGLGQ